MAGATPAWANIQSISCSTTDCSSRCGAPTRSATSSNDSHSSYEAQHDWWRDRYKGAADHLGVRPKIRDIGWHRLRANVAALVDWLRICYREGLLGTPPQPPRHRAQVPKPR
jgi:hypothetical protein